MNLFIFLLDPKLIFNNPTPIQIYPTPSMCLQSWRFHKHSTIKVIKEELKRRNCHYLVDRGNGAEGLY